MSRILMAGTIALADLITAAAAPIPPANPGDPASGEAQENDAQELLAQAVPPIQLARSVVELARLVTQWQASFDAANAAAAAAHGREAVLLNEVQALKNAALAEPLPPLLTLNPVQAGPLRPGIYGNVRIEDGEEPGLYGIFELAGGKHLGSFSLAPAAPTDAVEEQG
jgi:hypothetical protein